ncbi:MAG: DUF819 family protein, partial [Thermoguttaceae bacterium]
EEPMAVLAVLVTVLAGLFAASGTRAGRAFFKFIPLLVFAYFLPTVLSNSGVIPLQSDVYVFIKNWLLPSSLILLTMSVDIPAVMRLGAKQLALFLAGTATIVAGGPLAYLLLGWLVPGGMHDQAWRGLAALCGSWVGGGANFVAIAESVEATASTQAMFVVIDVVLANTWMAILLFMANNEKRIDQFLGADRSTLDELREKSRQFQEEVARPASLADLFLMLFIALAGSVVAEWAGRALAVVTAAVDPELSQIFGVFAWKVLMATVIGVAVSFTPLRALEGAGAGKLGSVFLYLLVASIGAQAQFAEVAKAPALLAIAAAWITFHAVVLLVLCRWLKAPIFCMAVGSQANIGGAASAPLVAAAFDPALASVGVLMAVLGYVLGTGGGLLCARVLQIISQWY